MMGITICAIGRLRQSPEAVLVSDYINRFNKLGRQLGLGPANLIEVEDKTFLHKSHKSHDKNKFHIKLIITSDYLKKKNKVE